MNSLTQDFVVIDTNVFEHLFHDGEGADSSNEGSHIDQLLDHLQRDEIRLLVDTDGKIDAEYAEYLLPKFKESELDTKRYILKYWMLDSTPQQSALDRKSRLFNAIKKVIHERDEECDRVFVFMSFSSGRHLVTNDRQHILFGPTPEKNTKQNNRYIRLRRETKKLRNKDAELLSSKQACERVFGGEL